MKVEGVFYSWDGIKNAYVAPLQLKPKVIYAKTLGYDGDDLAQLHIIVEEDSLEKGEQFLKELWPDMCQVSDIAVIE